MGELGQSRQLGPAPAGVSGQFARVDLQREAGAVGDENLAFSVEYLSARRAGAERPGAIVLRFGEVLFAIEHLQQPETQEENREEGNRETTEESEAQGQAPAHRGAALVGAKIHLLYP